MAALGLAPMLPALPATAAATATPAYTPYMYGLGAHMARSTGVSSTAMLMAKLRLSPAAARAMQAQLIRSGIVSAPNAAGLALASRPYMASTRITAASASAGRATRRVMRYLINDEETRDAPPKPDAPD